MAIWSYAECDIILIYIHRVRPSYAQPYNPIGLSEVTSQSQMLHQGPNQADRDRPSFRNPDLDLCESEGVNLLEFCTLFCERLVGYNEQRVHVPSTAECAIIVRYVSINGQHTELIESHAHGSFVIQRILLKKTLKQIIACVDDLRINH